MIASTQHKELGIRDPILKTKGIELDISAKRREGFERKAEKGTDYGGFYFIKADLGAGIPKTDENMAKIHRGGYHFWSKTLKANVIVFNSRNSKHPLNSNINEGRLEDETLSHELSEIEWMGKGFDAYEAHVIASAEEIKTFSSYKEYTELTPYHRLQLEKMTAKQREAIQAEDEDAREEHHEILARANKKGADIKIKKIKEYEEMLRQEARKMNEAKEAEPDEEEDEEEPEEEIDTKLIRENEIAVTFEYLKLAGLNVGLKIEVDLVNIGIKKAAKGRLEFTWHGIRFLRRHLQNGYIVWVFKAGDIEKFSLISNFYAGPGDDEVLCTPTAIKRTKLSIPDAKKLIEEIDLRVNAKNKRVASDVPLILGKGESGVRFFLRADKRGYTYWAFKREDVEKVAEIFGLLCKLEKGEVACSLPGFKGVGLVTERQRVEEVNNRLDEEADGANKVTLGKGDGKVTFKKRVKGKDHVWAFNPDDTEKAADIFELFLGVKDDEIACVLPALKKEGIFADASDIDEMESGLNMKAGTGKGKKREITHEGIEFFRRSFRGTPVWAFRKYDIEKVADIFGLLLKLGEDEIVCSGDGLRDAGFTVSDDEVARINTELERRSRARTNIVILGKGYDAVTFYRRKRPKDTVWAFKTRDGKKVAKHFDINLVIETEGLIDQGGRYLAEAVGLLAREEDPLWLKQYLLICHPEMTEDQADAVIIRSLEGLRPKRKKEVDPHEEYNETLPRPEIDTPPEETEENSFLLSGRVGKDIPFVQVRGAYTRRIMVRKDGTFSAYISLPKTGKYNYFEVYAFDPAKKEKSHPKTFGIDQTGTKQDVQEAYLGLLSLREELLQAATRDSDRYRFAVSSNEQALLKHFTEVEEEGFRYLAGRIKAEKSPTEKAILKEIEKKFIKIREMDFGVREGENLYFFQKYTIYEVLTAIKEGGKGIIIANEMGMGKTVTALMIVKGRKRLIITPNSVVTTWAEEEGKFCKVSGLNILEGTYAERDKELKIMDSPGTVVNIEFMQNMTAQRSVDLSRIAEDFLVVDESDFLTNIRSKQTKGIKRIVSKFKLLLSATPIKKFSQIGHILSFLRPNDQRFKSTRAFQHAFPVNSKDAMRALFLLMRRHTIRLRKRDVFKEYDPDIPLENQNNRLPKKVEIRPEDDETGNIGQFELTEEQTGSILELFTNYEAWCKKHKKYATAKDKEYRRYRKEGFFSKREALRQIMNDPAYIGRGDIESPKHKKMEEIVNMEFDKDPKRKVLIFCRYKDQVKAYKKLFKEYNPATYYGDLSADSNGYKITADGKKRLLYYKVDDFNNFVLDRKGKFIPSDKKHGRPIRALDYERIKFQNDPSSRIMIATYSQGGMGVTFTAADAVIYDDLAPTYKDQYQAGDRAHRIDNDRKKYNVTYYWLQALYQDSAIEGLDIPEKIKTKLFGNGTFDQIHMDVIREQGRIFHRIMDAVGSFDELQDIKRKIYKELMPGLFERGEEGVEDEEDDEYDATGEPEEVEIPAGEHKELGIRRPIDPELDLADRHEEFEAKAKDETFDEDMKSRHGIKVKIIYSDLGKGIVGGKEHNIKRFAGGYQFYSDILGYYIIVVNDRDWDVMGHRETEFHEKEEIIWIEKKGFDPYKAHVIASAKEVEKFSKGYTKLTPYHALQIEKMTFAQRKAIFDENEDKRRAHQEILKEANDNGAGINRQKIKEYEEMLRRKAGEGIYTQVIPNVKKGPEVTLLYGISGWEESNFKLIKCEIYIKHDNVLKYVGDVDFNLFSFKRINIGVFFPIGSFGSKTWQKYHNQGISQSFLYWLSSLSQKIGVDEITMPTQDIGNMHVLRKYFADTVEVNGEPYATMDFEDKGLYDDNKLGEMRVRHAKTGKFIGRFKLKYKEGTGNIYNVITSNVDELEPETLVEIENGFIKGLDGVVYGMVAEVNVMSILRFLGSPKIPDDVGGDLDLVIPDEFKSVIAESQIPDITRYSKEKDIAAIRAYAKTDEGEERLALQSKYVGLTETIDLDAHEIVALPNMWRTYKIKRKFRQKIEEFVYDKEIIFKVHSFKADGERFFSIYEKKEKETYPISEKRLTSDIKSIQETLKEPDFLRDTIKAMEKAYQITIGEADRRDEKIVDKDDIYFLGSGIIWKIYLVNLKIKGQNIPVVMRILNSDCKEDSPTDVFERIKLIFGRDGNEAGKIIADRLAERGIFTYYGAYKTLIPEDTWDSFKVRYESPNIDSLAVVSHSWVEGMSLERINYADRQDIVKQAQLAGARPYLDLYFQTAKYILSDPSLEKNGVRGFWRIGDCNPGNVVINREGDSYKGTIIDVDKIRGTIVDKDRPPMWTLRGIVDRLISRVDGYGFEFEPWNVLEEVLNLLDEYEDAPWLAELLEIENEEAWKRLAEDEDEHRVYRYRGEKGRQEFERRREAILKVLEKIKAIRKGHGKSGAKGSPSGFLETIRDNPDLLRAARNKDGFAVRDVAKQRKRKMSHEHVKGKEKAEKLFGLLQEWCKWIDLQNDAPKALESIEEDISAILEHINDYNTSLDSDHWLR